MEEIGQIIAQLKVSDSIRVITQDTEGKNMKVLTWDDFTDEEKAQLNACVEMIKTK